MTSDDRKDSKPKLIKTVVNTPKKVIKINYYLE